MPEDGRPSAAAPQQIADSWAGRAACAEQAVLFRSLRRVLGVPGTELAVVTDPPSVGSRLMVRWNFWWQAHLLDCAVDAFDRQPTEERRRRIDRLTRSIRWRNFGRFTNRYYDDMAWMALALQRASGTPPAIRPIVTAIFDAWSPPFGGIPWRIGDDFYNAPANGPAAILLARCGFPGRAEQMVDWIRKRLMLPGSELIADGVHPGERLQPVYYTYCQGVVLGAEVELAKVGRSRSGVHSLVGAVDRELTTEGVLRGHGGGDGGLFTGILARYLALVATDLPGDTSADREARSTAARLVLESAAAAWRHATVSPYGPLFGAHWSVPGRRPERDLSVQLSGWMLMEAAARLTRTPGQPSERAPAQRGT